MLQDAAIQRTSVPPLLRLKRFQFLSKSLHSACHTCQCTSSSEHAAVVIG